MALVLGGCAMAGSAKEGGDDDGEPDPYHLSWVDPSAIRMSPGDSATLGVIYVDPAGAPAIDTVSFALVGTAQDASLSDLERETDESGAAQVDLVASSVGSVFRLRASAPLAEEIFLDVSVSASGFGDLVVTPRFVGHREIESRDARIQTGAACADLDPLLLPPGDRSVPVNDLWEAVRFPDLAADPVYAAVVTGSVDGSVVAYGCADGIVAVAKQETTVEVVVDDLEPSPIGEYGVHTTLDLALVIPGAPDAWLEQTRSLLSTDGDPTGYLLERMGDYVEAAYDAGARGRFETATADDTTLRTALSTPERDPAVLVDSIAADVEAALTAPALESVLTIDPVQGGFEAHHDLVSLQIPGAAIDLEDDAPLVLADLSVVSQGVVAVSVTDGTLDFESYELELPLGTIAAAIADTVLPVRDGATDLADLFARKIDCDDVAQILVATGADADCDATCLVAACVEACVHAASSVRSSLSSADESLSRLAVEDGSATLLDEGGDLRAERLLSGSWRGTVSPSGLEFFGAFDATRIEEPAE